MREFFGHLYRQWGGHHVIFIIFAVSGLLVLIDAAAKNFSSDTLGQVVTGGIGIAMFMIGELRSRS